MLERYVQELHAYLCDGCRAIAVGLYEVRSGTKPADGEAKDETLRRQEEYERGEELKDSL